VDLWDVGRIVARRWYIAGPLLVLSLGLAVVMSGRVNPTYSTEASLLLVALGDAPVLADPTATTVFGETLPPNNPYLNFPSSLATVAQATGLSVQSDDERRNAADLGLEPGYEVGVEARSPLLYVRVSSGDSDVAVATMDHVVGLIESDLAQRQDAADAPDDARIEVEVLARSDQAAADQGGRSRVRLTVAGLGILVAIGAAVLFDAAVTRRWRAGDDGTDEPDEPAEPAEPPQDPSPSGDWSASGDWTDDDYDSWSPLDYPYRSLRGPTNRRWLSRRPPLDR
jgi:hypothetical protein